MVGLLVAVLSGDRSLAQLPLDKIKLPEGFQVSLYAEGVRGARSMALSPSGVLYVGTRDMQRGTRGRPGRVYAVVDRDNDFEADEVITVADGLQMPNGVVFHQGDLYVAEISKVWKLPNIDESLKDPPAAVTVNDSFPDKTHHGWKFLALGPDGKLYLQVGAPCNICESEDERFASIMRMNPDGTGSEVFARGVRNSVGFDWHPETHELWFTDNGRDWLGDDLPPDELNVAPRAGLHFGYPYCHGGDIADPEFGDKRDCSEFTPPALNLAPHVAALGMRFYSGAMLPAPYRHQIFIAEHGSWNRSRKIGFRVMLVRLENGRPAGYEVFAEGWLQGEEAWGRPVDLQQMPDGSLLVSDDRAGVIYRIRYEGDE